MKSDQDLDPPFIHFNGYKNINFCFSQKKILAKYGKTCPLCANLKTYEKGKITTLKSIVLKSCSIMDFYSEYYIFAIKKLSFQLPHVYIIGKNHYASKWHDMFVSKHNKYK